MELAPLWVVGVGALLSLVVGASARPRAMVASRGIALGAVLIAFCLAGAKFGTEALDRGEYLFGGTMLEDQLSNFFDLLLSFSVAALLLMMGPSRERAPEREFLLLAVLGGGMITSHAADLITVLIGVELVSWSSLALLLVPTSSSSASSSARRDAVSRALRMTLLTSAVLALGVALLYAGLSTTRLQGMGSRTSTIFTQWGAVQKYVEVVGMEKGVPAGIMAQAKGKVVQGMAPASLFIPGLLMVLSSIFAKLGLFPFLRRIDGNIRFPAVGVQSALVPLVLCALLLRLFVGSWHAPRLVNEPYGWTSLASACAVVSLLVAGVGALRERQWYGLVGRLSTITVASALLGLCASANFHGHRRWIESALVSRFELEWARVTGDAAFAAVVGLLVVHSLGILTLLAAWRARSLKEGLGVESWSGQGLRHPVIALGFALGAGTLLGLPGTVGFVAMGAFFRSLLQHPSLMPTVVAVVLAMVMTASALYRMVGGAWGERGKMEVGTKLPPGAKGAKVALLLCVSASVYLGVRGEQFIRWTFHPALGHRWRSERATASTGSWISAGEACEGG